MVGFGKDKKYVMAKIIFNVKSLLLRLILMYFYDYFILTKQRFN